jgi:hypothetical protein
VQELAVSASASDGVAGEAVLLEAWNLLWLCPWDLWLAPMEYEYWPVAVGATVELPMGKG